jgi:hypothetical protein
MKSDTSHQHALSITVPITRSLERLLHRAAMDRSQSAEELAKRILCDWLLKEGGIAASLSAEKRSDPTNVVAAQNHSTGIVLDRNDAIRIAARAYRCPTCRSLPATT